MCHALRFLFALLTGVAGSLVLSDSLLAQAWPQRTVRVIVPLPTGSAPDISARLFGEQLAARWSRPVIVENMPGADGILAAKEFISRQDEHTLLYSFAGLITINPLLYQKLPYDPGRDFTPIAITTDNFLAIAASGKLQVGSLPDLLKLARSRPNKLNWAATAGLPYFALASLAESKGSEMTYVAYKDFNQALADLGEGRIDVVSTGISQLIPHGQAGKLRLLAVLNRTRAPAARDIPTAAEAGHPELTFDGIVGYYGWRDMPAGLRSRIAADVRTVAEQAAIKERLAGMGIVARGSTPEEFAAAIEEQRAKVAAIAAAIGTEPTQ